MKISTPDGGGRGRMRAALITVGLVVVIVLVAGLLAARTDGARSFAADRLSKKMGEDVRIESMCIGWPYMLVLRNVESSGYAEGGAGFKADEVRVGWSCPVRRRLVIHRGVIRLVHMADGGWQPAVFARLGQLPQGHVSEVSGLTRELCRRMKLNVTEGRISWLDDPRKVTALAEGISFQIEPVRLPARRAHYYTLQVYSAMSGKNIGRLHDMRREWLVTEDDAYILTVQSGELSRGADDSFWGDAPQQVEGNGADDQS